MPRARGDRRARGAALGSGGPSDFDIGNPVVQTDDERPGIFVAAEDYRVRGEPRRLDPCRPRQRLALVPGQRRGLWKGHRVFAGETQTAPDERTIHGHAGCFRIVGIACGILRRSALFVAVVDEQGVRVVGRFGIFHAECVRPGVAVIQPEGHRRAALQIRDFHPHVGFIQKPVEFLDVRGKRGLVVGGDEADVTGIIARRG